MEAKEWQTFVTVVEEGNITKAAEKLFLSQPALSYRLKQVEDILGRPLLIRANDGIALTAEGELYYDYCRRMIRSREELRQNIGKVTGKIQGTLKIAASINFADYELPHLLNNFTKQYPKIRIEVNERKSKTIKMKTNSFEDRLSDNYTPANNTGKHDYRELYIVEGQKSALGSIIDGRNPDVQAVMGVRGMTLNAYKNTISKIMQNNEYSTLFKAIKYDPRNGNMDNFYFDKIIIATDADTDGGGIMGGLAGLFLLVGKPIVESGRLYRVLPPLYRIKNSGKKYAMDKSDLLQIYKENVVDSVNVYNKDGEKLSKKELSQFITDIENYLDTIDYISEHTSVDYRLIEMVGYIVTMSACGKIISEDSSNRGFVNGAIINDKKKLKSAIDSLFDNPKWVDNLMMTLNKKFPELRIEGRHISGPLYGRYQALNISVPFIRRFKSLIDIFIIYGINLSWSDKKSKKDKTYGTIAEFCNAMSKYNATIQTRFKGLGEAQYDEISETIMDPRKRRLVRLTITDLEEDLRKMRILHDDSQEYRVLRKQLMADYDVNPDEIDT